MAKKDWMVKESDLEKDDYEYQVLHAVLDKSCIVSGCAGSGKSVLALIKAQRVQREKNTNNYQIIVFTKALCKYMNAGRSELGLNKQFTYHWKFQNDGCPSSDYLIVDEIQDFDREEILEFINATNRQFFFFGDTAQSIYNGMRKPDGTIKNTLPVNRISGLIPDNKDFEIFNLCHNYRLPLPVARIAEKIGIGLPLFNENIYKSPEKEMPRIIQYDSFDRQMEAIARLINNGRLTDVGILVPHNVDVKLVHNKLKTKNISHEVRYKDEEDWRNSVDNLDFSTENPKVMTYHSAKGLQFGTVILPGIAPLYPSGDRRISEQKALYVAMTRTYRNLFIMYSGDLPYPLSEILPYSDLYKTTEVDEVEDI